LSSVAARMYLPFGENLTKETGGLSSSDHKPMYIAKNIIHRLKKCSHVTTHFSIMTNFLPKVVFRRERGMRKLIWANTASRTVQKCAFTDLLALTTHNKHQQLCHRCIRCHICTNSKIDILMLVIWCYD